MDKIGLLLYYQSRNLEKLGRTLQTGFLSLIAHYLSFSTIIFTARPEAQRCQVTLYVVNFAVAVAAAEGSNTLSSFYKNIVYKNIEAEIPDFY